MESKKINVGITGASGYSGVELVRLLSRHPDVALKRVTSRSLAGQKVADVMPSLRHALADDFCFTNSDPDEQAADSGIDVWFLALPHGVAAEYASALIKAGKTVIDLSADFRLGSLQRYWDFYRVKHPAAELLELGKYTIPEILPATKNDKLIACAGCYPTSILLPLIPLLRSAVIGKDNIVINSYSGVSGAGKKSELMYAFCERNESMMGYGMPKHRHLSEIEEQLSIACKKDVIVQFNPHLSPVSKGISTTIVVPAGASRIDDVYKAWCAQYAGKKFVKVLPSGSFPDTLNVVGTNRCDISAVYDERTNNFVITSVIDNIIKGASGQAVQIMNTIFGFDETAGLL